MGMMLKLEQCWNGDDVEMETVKMGTVLEWG